VAAWSDGYDPGGSSTPPAGLSGVTAIAAGLSHSLALKVDGTVVAWGVSYNGYMEVPLGLSNVVAIACGYSHDLALKQDGTVVAWGANNRGQTNVPPDLTNVVAIASYGYHSLALKSDRTVVAWGWDADGQSTVPEGLTNVVAISAGMAHSLALVGESAPCLTAQPLGLTLASGSDATFQVRAAGSPPLHLQWQFNGADLPGATNSVLTLTGVQLGNTGEYRCVLRNALGITTSAPALLTVLRPPLLFDTSSGALQMTNGAFKLTLTGLSQAGPVVLYSSTNLVDWEPIFTNVPVQGAFEFLEPEPSQGAKYYRASEGP
jgi:hypothetical protein